MKKIQFLSALILWFGAAYGQNVFLNFPKSSTALQGGKQPGILLPQGNIQSPSYKFAPPVSPTAVYSENFEGITPPALPSGMTTFGNTGSDKFQTGTNTTASSSAFTIPAHTNFAWTNDDACNCDKDSDLLYLPVQNFSGKSGLSLYFSSIMGDDLTPSYLDSAFVEVSTNGTTWTKVFSIPKIFSWNSYSVSLSAYNNLPVVLIRFRYTDMTNWGYGLCVDDISIDLPPSNDLAITQKYFNTTLDSTSTKYYTRIPLKQAAADTIVFGAAYINQGGSTGVNCKLTATVTGAQAFSGTSTPVNVLSGATDSANINPPYYTPNTIGTHYVDFTISGDSTETTTTNNSLKDTILVTDTVFARDNNLPFSGGWYGASYFIGNLFRVGVQDTVSTISVYVGAFSGAYSQTGNVMNFQIYDFNSGTPALLASYNNYTIKSTDLGTWVTIPVTPVAPYTSNVLAPGFYVAGFQSMSDTTLFVTGAGAPTAPPLTTFVNIGGTWSYATSIPFIRLNTKPIPASCTATLSSTVTNINCFGSNTGAVNITVSGGISPFAYNWSNAQTTQNITGLAAGTYSVSVTYNGTCLLTGGPYVVSQPADLVASATVTNVSCGLTGNGSATATATGGVSPYSFLWSNGQSGATDTALSVGTYLLTVTDSSGCTDTISVNVGTTELHGTACGTTDNIDTVYISGTTLNNPSTGCTNGNGQAFTIYPASGNTTASLQQGISYSFGVTSTANSIISIWIDYNQNNVFESSEWTQVTTSSVANVASVIPITIPYTSLTGQTKMRVRSRAAGSPNGAPDACTEFFSGETEQYTITILAGVACTNPPTAGTTVATANPVCSGSSFTLSLAGGTSGSGQTYQWQSSSDGITYADINGATSPTYVASQTASTYYRCLVTCSTSANSTPLFVTMNAPTQCYCVPTYSTACTSLDFIDDFTFNTLSKLNSGCNGNANNYIYDTTVTTTVSTGSSYSISVHSGSAYGQGFGVWIDYNQDGDFADTQEFVFASPVSDTALFTGNVSIPLTALPGQTRLRVRAKYGATVTSAEPCSNMTYGETEDYRITITAGGACTNPPTAGTATSSDSVVCSTDTFVLSLTGNSTGTGQTYQWQSSPDNSTWVNIPGATGTTFSGTQTSANYYRCLVTCGTSVGSASVFVNFQSCSCSPTYTNLCSSGDYINNFSFNTLSKQNSGCNGNANNYILDTSVTTSVVIGNSYSISMQSGATYAQGFGVWIDYNQNGLFSDAGEFVYASPGFAITAFTGTVNIPGGALPGTTILRVRCNWNDTVLSTESCTNFSYGETEDYRITITAPSPCTNPPTAGISMVNPASVCPGGTFFLSLAGNSTGTGQTYQWQSSPNNITFTNIPGATSDTLTTTASSSTYYRCVVTCGTSANASSVQVTMLTLTAGTASGPSTAIGNQVKTYFLTGNNGNITWQSSSDGITFADIAGATSNPQNLLLPGSAVNDTIYVRARISGPGCTDVFSNIVVTIIECATPYTNESSSGDFINMVVFGTINNSSTIDSLGGNVQDFKGTPQGTTHVCKGSSYILTVSTDSAWTQGKAAWIDFNNNGSYNDPGELIFGPTPTSVGSVSDTVTIPLSSVSDTVKMRVVCVYSDTPNVNACFIGPYGFGEIEEYSVIIDPTPDATITASGPLTFCQGSSLTLNTGTGGAYLWSTGATTQSISVSTSGNYSVTVTNNGACSSSDTVAVTANPSPTAATTAVNAACGGSNGSATVSASGGTNPYTYLWSNSATTTTISNLSAGTYFVTVTDASGCTSTGSASVNNIGGPSVAVSSSNVNCYGGNSGSASAVASGGTTPYSYLWSNGQTTMNATGLLAGTYTVTVTDTNSCIASSAITITQPAQLLVAPSTTNVLCYGGNNGTANANPLGGTSPYTYLWSGGQTTATISGLIAGTYTVSVTDSKSCTASNSVIITEPAAFSATLSSTGVSCNGASNGSATVTGAGGTGPYSFLWSGGQTTNSINNLAAGAISVTVTDNNGCTATSSGNISEPTPISVSVSVTNAACGSSNGIASASASGGTGSLSFFWSNGQTNSTATGLAVGTYNVTVEDANGCIQSDVATVGNNGAPTVSIAATDVSCSGLANGSAASTVSGGTTPYTYSWSNGQNSATATGLSAGIYNLTVTGNDGCSASSSDTVNTPAPIVSTTTSVDAACNGGSNGSVSVSVSGGSSPYTYLWSAGQTTATATGLPAGVYSVLVTDNNGCVDSSASATVSQPTAIVVSATSTNAGCGSSNGTATASATGGAGGFTFSWSVGQTGATATGLAAGTYTVSATDSTGCISSGTVSVSNSGAPLVTVSVSNIFCNGGNNGSATANATGGVTPYSYAWSNGQTTASANGLTAGNYTVTVTDNIGCSSIKSTTITEPPALTLSTTSTNASCGSSNGSASAIAGGGVTPYQYSWSGGQTTSTINILSAGIYQVTITDANGCLTSSSATVSNAGAPAITVTSQNVTCEGGNNGSASVSATGGATPYTYVWSDGQTTSAATGLAEGNYSVTVSDALSCQSFGTTAITALSQSPSVSLGGDTASCGTITLNAGSGFSSYLWSNSATTPTISVSASGNYSVLVTDSNGCSNSDTVAVTINSASVDLGPDTVICLENDSTYILDAGSGFASYLWSNGSTGQTLTVNADGVFSVTVVDSNGCTDNDTSLVSFQVCAGISEINGSLTVSVYPNPNKGQFTVYHSGQPVSGMKIFNVLGEKVYDSSLNTQQSPLTIDLRNQGEGIYFLQIISEGSVITKRIIVE